MTESKQPLPASRSPLTLPRFLPWHYMTHLFVFPTSCHLLGDDDFMFLFVFRPYCLEQILTYGRLKINTVEWTNLVRKKKAASCPVLIKRCSSVWMGTRKWTIVPLRRSTTKKFWNKTILTWKPLPASEATTFILTSQRLRSAFTGGRYIVPAAKVGETVQGWNENVEKC